MLPISIMKLFWWIPSTLLSETTLASTGSLTPSTSTVREEVLHLQAANTVVYVWRVTAPITPSVVPTELPGRDATPRACVVTVKCHSPGDLFSSRQALLTLIENSRQKTLSSQRSQLLVFLNTCLISPRWVSKQIDWEALRLDKLIRP